MQMLKSYFRTMYFYNIYQNFKMYALLLNSSPFIKKVLNQIIKKLSNLDLMKIGKCSTHILSNSIYVKYMRKSTQH